MNNLFRATNTTASPIKPQSNTYSNSDINNYTENRGATLAPPNDKKSKKKLDFKTMKTNTISSLNDVEFFLNNLNKISRYMKVFKFFK